MTMIGRLDLHSPLKQALGQLLQQAVSAGQGFGFFVSGNQLVKQFVVDIHSGLLGRGRSILYPLGGGTFIPLIVNPISSLS